VHLVLVEGASKRSADQMSGRTCTNKRVIVNQVVTGAEYIGGAPLGGRGLHSFTLQLNLSRFRHKIHP
jgi:hypothetical protein